MPGSRGRITVTAPKGTILNCEHPAAVELRIGPCQRVVDLDARRAGAGRPGAADRSLQRRRATRRASSGAEPSDGSVWVYLETIGGGSGARATKDGLDGVQVHMTNTSNLPVEALELEYPLTLLRYELVDGSGGAGTFRGGMGLRRVYRADAECRVGLDGSRLHSPPWGLAGGLPGGKGEFRFSEGTEPFRDGAVLLRPGDIVEIVTPGAGGYGPPQKRDRELVERDVREGRIQSELAREIYGRAT